MSKQPLGFNTGGGTVPPDHHSRGPQVGDENPDPRINGFLSIVMNAPFQMRTEPKQVSFNGPLGSFVMQVDSEGFLHLGYIGIKGERAIELYDGNADRHAAAGKMLRVVSTDTQNMREDEDGE